MSILLVFMLKQFAAEPRRAMQRERSAMQLPKSSVPASSPSRLGKRDRLHAGGHHHRGRRRWPQVRSRGRRSEPPSPRAPTASYITARRRHPAKARQPPHEAGAASAAAPFDGTILLLVDQAPSRTDWSPRCSTRQVRRSSAITASSSSPRKKSSPPRRRSSATPGSQLTGRAPDPGIPARFALYRR